jgi:uncharacterized protein YecA (UPF0149 family)
MPLSIDKLIGLLEKKGFIPRKYYVDGGYCRFIEILSINTIDSYFLHIPERYNFEPRTSDKHNVYRIKQIPITKPDNIEQKYAGKRDNEEIMKEYGEIELPSQYPHQIKDIDNIDIERDNTALYCIFRQLKRLQYCVQFLKYRFGIIYKDYLAILRSDNTIKCYRIRNNEHTQYRSLYITIDLEVFYENSKVLNEDLEQLQNGIRGVLDKNHEVQSKHLDTMLTQQQQIITVLSKLQQRKINIRIELQKFKELFKTIEESIKNMTNKIHKLGQLIAQSIGQKQEQYVKEKHNIYMRLTQLYSKKEETAQVIINNRKYEHHLSLNIDRILFDNNVMLDKIFKNVSQLTKLENNI